MEICKNCSTSFIGNYCNQCGQKVFSPSDKSIKKILQEIFYFFTNFDNGFFKTIFTIITKPGQLSAGYSAGKQKTYFKPISLYFLIVVIYLIFPIFSGLNQDLKYYIGNPIIGEMIENQIADKLENEHLTLETLSVHFKAKSEVTSKMALFLFILVSLLFIHFLFYKSKHLTYDHLILSTEINIFYLLVLFILLPLVLLTFMTLFDMNRSFMSDELIGLIFVFLFGVYCTIIFRRIFDQSRWLSLAKGMTFSFLHVLFFITIYRFIVFKLTFMQI
jgi:hypothetical protein